MFEKRSTCAIGIPFDVGKNVMMAFKAEESCSCHRYASKFAEDKDDAKYLFWSFSEHRFSKAIGGNCFVFKTCDDKTRISLTRPGVTYQLKPKEMSKSGMRRI